MSIKVLQHKRMIVKCNHCQSILESDNIKDFKEFNTMPPSIGFICPSCKSLARLDFHEIPERIQSILVNKVGNELMSSHTNYHHPLYETVAPYFDVNDSFNKMGDI